MADPAAQRELAVADRILLQHEAGVLLGVGAGHEGFFADGREPVVPTLEAEHTAQRAASKRELGLLELEPEVRALVLEGRGHLARAFNFLVLVVGVEPLAADAGDRPRQVAHLTGQRVLVQIHVDRHVFLGHDAVVAAEGVGRGAEVAVVPDERATDGATVALALRVDDRRPQFGAAIDRPFERGNAHVVGLAVEAVAVDDEAVAARLDDAGRTTLGGRPAVAQFGGAGGLGHRSARNAVVDRIDHAADGAAAVEQGRRPAQHLDTFDHQRVDRHRVVVAQARRVECDAGIAEQLDPVAVHAANDRPVGVGAEVACRDTGQAIQRFAQRAAAPQHEAVAAQHGGRAHHVGRAQRIAGDDDRRQVGLSRRRRCGVGCRCRRGLGADGSVECRDGGSDGSNRRLAPMGRFDRHCRVLLGPGCGPRV